MNIENNSVQNSHIAKTNKDRIFAAMVQHPDKKALEKLSDQPYALKYAKKHRQSELPLPKKTVCRKEEGK